MKARRMSTVCSIAQSAERIAWRRAKKAVCLILTFMLIISQISYALPTDPQVEHGQATFDVKDNTMTVNASNKAVINYGSFNIAPHEAVIINLPSTSSSILNRDIGGNISRLEGLLQSNGLVILVNTAGIYVAPTANINVGGIILSTRDINTQDFINSNYVFQKISKDHGANDLLNSPGSATTQYIAGKLRDRVRAAKTRVAANRVLLGTFPPQFVGMPPHRGSGAPFVPELNQRIAAVAQSEGATPVDLYAAFPAGGKPYIGVDGLHPTQQGFTLMAETFAKVIQEKFEVKPTAR